MEEFDNNHDASSTTSMQITNSDDEHLAPSQPVSSNKVIELDSESDDSAEDSEADADVSSEAELGTVFLSKSP